MLGEPQIASITHAIQLAVAPVFLLTAVGTLIGVLTSRLGRAVDRRRLLEEHFSEYRPADAAIALEELHLLARRIRLVYIAISLAVLCALFVCFLIASTFVGAFVVTDLSRAVGVMFVLAMLALIGSLVVFLREIFLAVLSARHAVPPPPIPPAV